MSSDTPHIRPPTNQSRQNDSSNPLQMNTEHRGPQTMLEGFGFPGNQGNYHVYPMEDVYSGPQAHYNYGAESHNYFSTEGHWMRDENGQIVSTLGRVQEVPSDAGSDYLENLESVPLPENATPPPAPGGRSARLPSATPSLGPSRIGSPIRSSEFGLLRTPSQSQPKRIWTTTTPHPAEEDNMNPNSPQTRFFPDQPMTSSPEQILPRTPDPTSSRQATFSPFRSNPSRLRMRRGSSLDPHVHPGMPFEPQSTSSPPHTRQQSQDQNGRQRGKSTSGPSGPQPPPPPSGPPPRSPTSIPPMWSSPAPPQWNQDTHQYSSHPPPMQMPVNLPGFHDERPRQATPQANGWVNWRDYYEAKPPHWPPPRHDQRPHYGPFPPPHHGPPDFNPFPNAYGPYGHAQDISFGAEWDGRRWYYPQRGPSSGEQVPSGRENKLPGNGEQEQGQDRPPLRRTDQNRTVHRDINPNPPMSSKAKGKQREIYTPVAGPSTSKQPPAAAAHSRNATLPPTPSDSTPTSAQKQLDTLQGPVQEHFANLERYLKNQTDPAFVGFLRSHFEITARIPGLFVRIVEFVQRSVDGHAQFPENGSERWLKRWRKQLSSLERTMDAFCQFSKTVYSRKATMSLLTKILDKLQEYETKFRDLAKKFHSLMQRLSLRGMHNSLAREHNLAKEQLRIARSKRDLPDWDQHKLHRAGLREKLVELRNDIASSRRSSWTKTPPAPRI